MVQRERQTLLASYPEELADTAGLLCMAWSQNWKIEVNQFMIYIDISVMTIQCDISRITVP